MVTMVDNLCPVCGYEMEDPPRDYNICPSCGTEFGVHDVNAGIEQLRRVWLQSGPRWQSTTDEQPQNWKPLEQLSRLLFQLSYAGNFDNQPAKVSPKLAGTEQPVNVEIEELIA